MVPLSQKPLLMIVLVLSTLTTSILSVAIGIPTGELGNINGLYGKPFSSSTVMIGAGTNTFRPHNLTAANGFIALNGEVGIQCEDEGVTDCPHKPETGFRVYFNGTADLNTDPQVSQQLYVTPTGRLGYNPVGATTPRGAILGKFELSYTPGAGSLAAGRHWSFAKDESNDEKETSGMWACSGGDTSRAKGVKAVFAGVDGFDQTQYKKCHKIDPSLTPLEDEGPSAYAYT